jgi:drug/metabolite transporter (DMT)-like permease
MTIKIRAQLAPKFMSFLYLWIAITIFAASNSVTRKVTEIGTQNLIQGRNPISFCNILFVGNLCALIVMAIAFGREFNRRNLSQLNRGDWLSLSTIAILSGTLSPALVFAALNYTTVNNVVLFTQLKPPIALLLSAMFLGARVNRWTKVGSLVSFVGVGVTALLAYANEPLRSSMGLVGSGELFAIAGAIVGAISTVLSKNRLQRIPLGIFSIVQTAIGTIVFFLIANIFFGSEHFADGLSPLLWKWMLLYGVAIVMAGQVFWFAGLRHSTSAQVTLATSTNPIAAVIIAYLILGEVPTTAQYVGGGVVAIGILLSLIGNLRDPVNQTPAMACDPIEKMNEVSGFKGI